MDKSEKSILATAVSSHALTHVAELAFPATALLVSLEFFGRPDRYAEIGLAASISAFLFGLAALPSGWLVDRLGARRMLLVFLFGTGVSLLALSQSPGFYFFIAGLAALGFFSGLYHPIGTTMISLGIREHGKAMGAHGVGGNLGLAATPFLAAALAQAVGGWRWAYAIIALFPLLLGLLIALGAVEVIRRPRPEPTPEKQERPARLYLMTPLVILFAMAVFNGMAYRGMMTFLPAYFAQKASADLWIFGWSPTPAPGQSGETMIAGALTTLVLLVGAAGQFAGGWLADRYRKEKVYTAVFLLSFPVLFSLALLEGAGLVAAAAVFAFLFFANQPVGNAMLPRYTGASVRGFVFGLFFFMSFGVGAVMGWLAGWVGARFELGHIFYLLAACLLISSSLGFLLIRSTRELK